MIAECDLSVMSTGKPQVLIQLVQVDVAFSQIGGMNGNNELFTNVEPEPVNENETDGLRV